MTQIIKSKYSQTLPIKGLFYLISSILKPSPFQSINSEVFEFPMIIYELNIQQLNTWYQIQIKKSKDMKLSYIVFCLLLLTAIARKHLTGNVEKTEETKTIVESNHYFSTVDKIKTYKINNLKKKQPLVFVLKDNSNKEALSLTENPITITLYAKDGPAVCQFNTVHNLCAVKKVDQDEIQMKISCKKTPCQLSWIIYQPPAIQEDGIHNVDNLVEINKHFDHAMILARCNDPNIKNLEQKLNVYTNSKYQTIVNQEGVSYLFDSEEKGYYYINTENPAVKNCVKVTLYHAQDTIQFDKDSKNFHDFIMPGKKNSYQIDKEPETDFRLDAFYHTALDDKLTTKSGIQLTLFGQKGSQKTKLRTIKVDGVEERSISFSAVFKKQTETYQRLYVQVENSGRQIILIFMGFSAQQRQEVELGQRTYFNLHKGQKINYKLVPLSQGATQPEHTYIFSSNETSFVPSVKECKSKVGCEFTIQANEEGQGNLYFGQGIKQNVTERIVIEFDKSYSSKIKQGQNIYLKRKVTAKKSFQAVVNTPNVVIYAGSDQVCKELDNKCHQKVLNSHNPFIYQSQKNGELLFKVIGLDNCEFRITILESGQQYIQLQDTKPFTYLFDDGQKQLKFSFKLDKRQDVNFNLVGPVNQLNLIVSNSEEITENTDTETSSEGYISFAKDDIKSLNFVVKVQKREEFVKKYIHFTLIVSTKEGNVRLEPGVSHFENIKGEETRDYVFQFEPKKQILLNFYTHNVKPPLNIDLKVSTTDQYDKKQSLMSFNLDQPEEVLDLKQVSAQLCKDKQAENCQLFVRLQNKMGIELDITLTLMIKDSIIQLKDGVWNSFKETEVSKTSHFFFLPKHPNKSVTILYKATLVDLKIMYTIWKTDDHSMNPGQWPFPAQFKNKQGSENPALTTRPTKIIHIDSENLKQCWPNCVILLSIFEDKTSLPSQFSSFVQNPSFMVMASNNYIQVPQKHKIDLMLKKDEDKHLLVDLKYVLQKNALTFFTYFTMGKVRLSGNVYDQKNPRCPTTDQPGDFMFGNLQTQISTLTIKKKLQQNQMSEEKHPYICILARAIQDSKFSIEYDSDDEIITQIILDSSYVHRTYTANQKKLFQHDGSQQFTLKITRNAGFPFISKKICKSGDDFEDCLNDFKSSNDKGEQLIQKMLTITHQACQKCIMFIKITTPETSEINIHSQSKYSQTELPENQVVTDQIKDGKQNKYILTTIKNQQILINIQITHGDLSVSITDFAGVNLNKTNQKGSNHIQITIPPKNVQKTQLGMLFFSAFARSTFDNYHLVVKSQDPKAIALYSITYSSGEHQTYLQDGLISSTAILPGKTAKMLYRNPSVSKIYFHLSAPTSQILSKLQIKIRALNNQNDEQSGVELTPQKTNFAKKTPNPTMIMSLPANKFFQISITNNNKQITLITIGINNQEIIYLPSGHQFPVQLQKNQQIYVVVNSALLSFLQVQFKKCDESSLTIAYTTNYQQFAKQQFEHEQQMDRDLLINSIHLKLKNNRAVYFKLKASPEEESVLTMKANLMFVKTKPEKTTAGGKGLLNYQLLDSRNAELNFAPVSCPSYNKNCNKQFSYASISSEKIQAVYAQLVCPAIAFDLEDRQIISKGHLNPITATPSSDGRILFRQTMSGDLEYVGVKATNNKTGEIVYYKPVQIATFWGQVQKSSKGVSSYIIMGVLSVILLCCILIAIRRRSKQISEYAPLNSLQ